jgi:hypothetical protein
LNTSNAASPSSLASFRRHPFDGTRERAEELARRTKALEERPRHARRRTWGETKTEILGHHE